MNIYAIKDEGVDISEFKERLGRHLDIDWIEKTQDFSAVPWVYYDDDSKGVDKKWINQQAQDLYETQYENVDIVFCFIGEENWQNGEGRIWGWHLGNPMHSYEICQVKMRRRYDDTAIHEFMHSLDDLIYVELGIRLEDILNVRDYDDDVVHGEADGYEEYEYGDTLDILKPYINDAILARRKKAKRNLLEKLAHYLRLKVRELQAKVNKMEARPKQEERGLQPIVEAKAQQLLALGSVLGYTLRITSGYRSIEEQQKLYAQGRTKPGNVITNAQGGESLHNYGVAFDVVDRWQGYDIDWEELGAVGKAIGLEWGGDWDSFTDRPHFQYLGGHTLADFQNGNVDYEKFNTIFYS